MRDIKQINLDKTKVLSLKDETARQQITELESQLMSATYDEETKTLEFITGEELTGNGMMKLILGEEVSE